MLDFIRGIVRPVVTVLFVATQIALAVLWATGHDVSGAFEGLGTYTALVVTFWFVDRSKSNGS